MLPRRSELLAAQNADGMCSPFAKFPDLCNMNTDGAVSVPDFKGPGSAKHATAKVLRRARGMFSYAFPPQRRLCCGRVLHGSRFQGWFSRSEARSNLPSSAGQFFPVVRTNELSQISACARCPFKQTRHLQYSSSHGFCVETLAVPAEDLELDHAPCFRGQYEEAAVLRKINSAGRHGTKPRTRWGGV
jgi:hypothetical protein